MTQRKGTWIKLFLRLSLLLLLLPAAGAYAEDTQAPVPGGIIIADQAVYTALRAVSVFISATDDAAVTGYYLSETFSVPELESFNPVPPTPVFSQTVAFSLSDGDALKTIYAWFRDEAGNISNATADDITLDAQAPFDTGLAIDNEAGSVSSSLLSLKLSAHDTIGIAGYYLSENAQTPQAVQFTEIDRTTILADLPVEFSLSPTLGLKTVYAWFIDAAGNISPPASLSVNFSHGWFRIFGSDAAEDANGIAVDDAGNTYIVGSTKGAWGDSINPSLVDYSAFITKISASGDIVWTKLVGTTHSTRGNYVAVDKSGNVFIGGTYDGLDGSSIEDAFLAKFDAAGKQEWLNIIKHVYTHSVERLKGIGTDDAGHVYVAGYTNQSVEINPAASITYPNGVFIAKYDTDGNNLWGYPFFPDDAADIYHIAVNGSGDIFITGETVGGIDGLAGKGSQDLFIAKFNAQGTKQWVRLFGTPYPDWGSKIVLDMDGNIYITGPTWGDMAAGTDTGQRSQVAGFIGKFNGAGERQWINVIESTDMDVFMEGLAVDRKGGVYTAGTQDNNGNWDMFVFKYNADGYKRWAKAFGGDGAEQAGGLAIGPGDLLYMTGSLANFTTGFAGQPMVGSGDVFFWKSATDALFDITPPTGTLAIDGGATTTYFQTVTLNLAAADNVGIIGYHVSESSLHPSPSTFVYRNETLNFANNIEYTFTSDVKETKRVYAWYADAFGNYSAALSAEIQFSTDMDPPEPGVLIINGGAASTSSTTLTLAISAADNVAVTGYYISEGFETPALDDFIAVTPTAVFAETLSYTLKDPYPGTIYISVWFRDAAGNVNDYASRAQSTIELKIEDTTPPTTTASLPAGYYDGPQTVTLTCRDDFNCLLTWYTTDGENVPIYIDPFEITPPVVLRFLSTDYGFNYEAVQSVTYGLTNTITDTVLPGDVKIAFVNIVSGSTLNIAVRVMETPAGAQGPLEDPENCPTPVTLKKPDGSVYGSYRDAGNALTIFISHAAGGLWSIEVDRSGCSQSATYEAIIHQLPAGGYLPGSATLRDIIKYLQVLTRVRPAEVDPLQDMNHDKRIGLADVIYLLQKFSNTR